MTRPDIAGPWIVQWYGNVPAVGKVRENVPDDFVSELAPWSKVTLWSTQVCPAPYWSPPLHVFHVQPTVVPAATVSSAGVNRSFDTVTELPDGGGGVLPPPLGPLEYPPPLQAAAVMSVDAKRIVDVRRTMRMSFSGRSE